MLLVEDFLLVRDMEKNDVKQTMKYLFIEKDFSLSVKKCYICPEFA